ncbi:MAG TPA: hypothetical protein VJX67_23350 [Blastocatellia bacterium]|nr:hypothetical protein [Blastocatellia bacterium]
MNVKIEDMSSVRIKNGVKQVERTLGVVPSAHLIGLTKIVLVDVITEPRISTSDRSTLPALYHPKMGGQTAWAEIATTILLPKKKISERFMSRLTIKPNLAQVVLSLVAQHYHFTLARGIKKTEIERACRAYTEKYSEKWRESQGGLRMRLTKPFRPTLDRWAKKLSKKYKKEVEKKNKSKTK